MHEDQRGDPGFTTFCVGEPDRHVCRHGLALTQGRQLLLQRLLVAQLLQRIPDMGIGRLRRRPRDAGSESTESRRGHRYGRPHGQQARGNERCRARRRTVGSTVVS